MVKVAKSGPQQHNTAVYLAACALGQLIAGHLDRVDFAEQVDRELTAVALHIGQTPTETAKTIASGLRAGATRSRTITPTGTAA